MCPFAHENPSCVHFRQFDNVVLLTLAQQERTAIIRWKILKILTMLILFYISISLRPMSTRNALSILKNGRIFLPSRSFYDHRTKHDTIYAPLTAIQPNKGSPLGVIRVSGIKTAQVLSQLTRHNHPNEDDYIYRHVCVNLIDRFVKSTSKSMKGHQLPINHLISQIEELTDKKQKKPSDNNARLEELLAVIKDKISLMKQDELAILLTAIRNNSQHEFNLIKKYIDQALARVLNDHVRFLHQPIDLDFWLYLSDVFYECQIKPKLTRVLIDHLAKERNVQMTKKQFLHLLFLVILMRTQNNILFTYEDRILNILKRASFEDITTISLAYFKTKTPIDNLNILSSIVDRLTQLLPSVQPNEPGYCAIVKSIRYSRKLECRENILNLVKRLTSDKDNSILLTSSYNAVQTIKMMETYRIYDERVLDIVVSNMFSKLDKFRIKDIQYALSTLSNLSYQDLQLSPSVVKNLDRLCSEMVLEKRKDIEYQPYHLMPILRAFSIFGYYNRNLMNYVNQALENPNKFEQMRQVLEFEKSALLLYTATRLEASDQEYLKGPGNLFEKLSTSIEREGNLGSVRRDSSINHLNFILKSVGHIGYYENSHIYRNIAESLESNEQLKDPAYQFNFQFTLPHQNYTDLVISKHVRGPGQFDRKTLAPANVPENHRYCLLLATRSEDFVDGLERLSGYKRLIARLLTKLGYCVVKVNFDKPDIDALARKIKYELEAAG